MSTWDKIQNYAIDKATDSGVKIRIATDLGTDTIVFDTDAPPGKESKQSLIMPEYQVTVENREGKAITQYGEKPQFNIVKASVLYGALFFGALIVLKGLKGMIE